MSPSQHTHFLSFFQKELWFQFSKYLKNLFLLMERIIWKISYLSLSRISGNIHIICKNSCVFEMNVRGRGGNHGSPSTRHALHFLKPYFMLSGRGRSGSRGSRTSTVLLTVPLVTNLSLTLFYVVTTGTGWGGSRGSCTSNRSTCHPLLYL